MKSTLISALAGFLLPISALMAFNFAQDPYFFYGIPDDATWSTNERWQNPGLIRHLDYNTVVIGTSRSQNFKPEMFSPAGWRILKATAAGSMATEQLSALNLAIDVGRVERVVIELSHISFTARAMRNPATFPDFLYTSSLETPFSYLLSYDLLFHSLGELNRTALPLDELNVWWTLHRHKFNEETFLRGIAESCNKASAVSRTYRMPHFETELARFDQLVRSAPHVEFHGFLPPIAAIALTGYDARRIKHVSLETRMQFRQAVSAIAERHSNLTVYDYATQEDIVLDMTRYKDPGHFDIEVNKRIAKEITSATGPLLNALDVNGALLRIRDQVDRSKLPCTT